MGTEHAVAIDRVHEDTNGRSFLPNGEVARTPNRPVRDVVSDLLLGESYRDQPLEHRFQG
jgi:hypothetical protein